MFLYDNLGGKTKIPKSSKINFNKKYKNILQSKFVDGFQYYDVQVDDKKLVEMNIDDSKKMGATILEDTKVIDAKRNENFWEITLDNNEVIKSKILIVDLEVHQGNVTAEIFQNEPAVFTFSMHGRTNYPFHKEQSDLDIPLENETGDDEFLSILKSTLSRLIKEQKPDFIYYLCGVDVIASDKLGKLSLSLEGCKERDRFVLQSCYDAQIPVMCSMGGGYSEDIKIIVEAHANTFRLAQDIFF